MTVYVSMKKIMGKVENFRVDCKILVDLFEFIGAFNC